MKTSERGSGIVFFFINISYYYYIPTGVNMVVRCCKDFIEMMSSASEKHVRATAN